jgi:glyoxylase-like metal-dependent hydrolase (beta-lactamase superfamily II)
MCHSIAKRLPAIALVMMASATARAAPALSKDATAHVERVADGVYAILHDDATDEWPHSNTGVIVGDDGVLVIDSTYLPSRARGDIALIRALTPKPVRYLVFTHWHFDHNNGTSAYQDAFPGMAIVSERETGRFIDVNGIWWSKMTTAAGSKKRLGLQEKQAQLVGGKNAGGQPLSAVERKRLETLIAQRKGELEELASLRVVPPTLVFDHELTLTLGRRHVVLHDWGRANSPHDVTIYLPDERVLFSGDILVQSPLPYSGASWPVPWSDVLRQIEAIPVAVLVPGHGPVMHDHAYTRQVRELMEAVTSRVEVMVRKGLTLEQIQATIDLDDLRKGPWIKSEAAPDEDWKITVDTLVERAWRGVRGQG